MASQIAARRPDRLDDGSALPRTATVQPLSVARRQPPADRASHPSRRVLRLLTDPRARRWIPAVALARGWRLAGEVTGCGQRFHAARRCESHLPARPARTLTTPHETAAPAVANRELAAFESYFAELVAKTLSRYHRLAFEAVFADWPASTSGCERVSDLVDRVEAACALSGRVERQLRLAGCSSALMAEGRDLVAEASDGLSVAGALTRWAHRWSRRCDEQWSPRTSSK